MRNPLTELPARLRYWLYMVYALAGVGIGAVDVWGSETLFGNPLENYLRVYAYMGLALGFTAASNTPAPEVAEYDGKHERGAVNWAVVIVTVVVVLLLLLLLVRPGLR